MQKGKWLALVMALVLMLAMTATAFAADYKVTLPSGYDGSSLKYPTIYIMPENGYAADNSGLAAKLADANMIIVRPELAKGEDVNMAMAKVVSAVDTEYRTIADPAHRAVVGTGVGGYLAYVTALESSSPFGFVASVRGDFASNENPWLSACGSVMEKIKACRAADKAYFDKIYTYMDAPVDDPWTNMEGSSNDMGALFIDYGTGSEFHEFTVRPGAFTNAFFTESANRLVDRLQKKMYAGLLTGSVKLGKAALTTADKQIAVDYTVKVSNAFATYADGSTKMRVRATVKNDGDEVVAGSTSVTVSGAETFTGRIVMDNKLPSGASNVVLTAEIMGAEIEVATASVVLVSDPVAKGDYQHIDLMGDWYFNYVGWNRIADPAALTKTEYTAWSIAQPGFSNWTKGHGNISDANVSSPWGPSFFDYMIIGDGYYVKNFTVPKDFDAQKFVLSIGYADDRCEVWLNGKRIGATGLDEKGDPTGDTTWAVYSSFPVDRSDLNIGGENTVIVRVHNDGVGGGGWYKGPIGLYSEAAFAENSAGGDTSRFYEETYYSKAIGKEMEYLIYLPESYGKDDRFYPTVYLLHQYNSDHTSYRTDAVDKLFDEGVKEGIFDEMIVVIPNSEEESWWRGKWMDMVSEDLIPHIEANYRCIPDPRYRLTAGCSMGGQGAMGVALTNPNLFSAGISFFGAFSMGGAASPNTVAPKVSDEYLDYYSMYFICGNQDVYGFGAPAIELNQELQGRGIEHYFFIENGEHNSAFYLPRFKSAFQYTRGQMYKMPETDVYSLLSANYGIDEETGDLLVAVEADEAIRDLFLTVPDSPYTKDTNPGVTVPMIVTVKTKGGVARAGSDEITVRFNATFDDNTLRVVERIPLSQMLPKGATVTDVQIETQLLGGNNAHRADGILPLAGGENPSLPETGDGSNLMLLIATMMISVMGLFVLGRKKAAC